VPNPQLQPEELFEDEYTATFEGLVRRRGLLANFRRDRARLDVGLMLNQLGTLELSGTKVWFQLKGVHKETVTADDLTRAGHVAISVRLDDLRFWYAAPEATYLVAYVEAIDAFLAEDVRDIVDRQWGVNFLAPGRFGLQETITVHVAADAVLDDRALDSMLAHRSMRIDGPAFRGRPLGHRLDPLRCGLAELDPNVFDSVVDDLLKAHSFTNVIEHDSARLIADGSGQRVRVLTGTLYTTYEYPFAGSIEIGFGRDAAPLEDRGFRPALREAKIRVTVDRQVVRTVSSPPIAALTRLAEAAYALSDPGSWKEKWPPSVLGVITDPDRSQLMSLAANACQKQLNDAARVLSAVPDLSIFAPTSGPFDPALVYPGGSLRQPFSQFVVSLLVSAAQRFYFFRQESTHDSFVAAVIENYEDFLHQGRGEVIKAYDLVGYTGLELSPGSLAVTPWGVLRPAPSNFRVGLQFNRTTAILAAPCTMALKVSREEYPLQLPPDDSVSPSVAGARQLLPMAFALASHQNPRCAPMVTFEAVLLPLLELNSYRHPGILFPMQPTARASAEELKDAEAWAEQLEESRAGTLQIAERRLVSAIAQRSEKVDSLIDAVIAWESLVGTRRDKADKIPSAMATLLKNEPYERSILFDRLKEIYSLRTDVVHGHAVSDTDVSAASNDAIEAGLEAVRELHNRSGKWLTMSSNTRARKLSSEAKFLNMQAKSHQR
jgi:hypothetical protein